jgi:hypothetical protein
MKKRKVRPGQADMSFKEHPAVMRKIPRANSAITFPKRIKNEFLSRGAVYYYP